MIEANSLALGRKWLGEPAKTPPIMTDQGQPLLFTTAQANTRKDDRYRSLVERLTATTRLRSLLQITRVLKGDVPTHSVNRLISCYTEKAA